MAVHGHDANEKLIRVFEFPGRFVVFIITQSWPIKAIGYCHALCHLSVCSSVCASVCLSIRLSIRPALMTTLQPTISNRSCSYLVQPLTVVGAWILLIMGFLCSLSRMQWDLKILWMHSLTGQYFDLWHKKLHHIQYIPIIMHTVHILLYFVVFCYHLIPAISFRVASLVLRQSYMIFLNSCLFTLKNISKLIPWILEALMIWPQQSKAHQNHIHIL